MRNRKHKRLLLVGRLHGIVGRPLDVHCRWRIGEGKEAHEVGLTEFCMCFDAKWKRGYKLPFDLDALMEVDGAVIGIEFDLGTEDKKQILDKFKKLKDCPHPVVFVVHDDTEEEVKERMEKLIEWGEEADTGALYVSLADSQRDGLNAVLSYRGNEKVTLAQTLDKIRGKPVH